MDPQSAASAPSGRDNPERRSALIISLFLSVVLIIWAGLHAYVFWRIAGVPVVARHVPAWALIAVAVFLWASLPAGRLLAGPTFAVRALEWIGGYWLGILFLAFVCLLAADLATGFGFWWKSHAPSLRGWALAAAAVLSAIALVQALRAPVVRDYEVRLAGLPADADGLTLVVVSDVHLSEMEDADWMSARVAQVQALRGDLIAVVGDVDESHADPGRDARLASVLRELHAPLGVWAVLGNHDVYAGVDASVRFFEASGFRLLRNEWKEARPGLVIAGVDDVGDVDKALAGKPAGEAAVLLSHRPRLAAEAARDGAGLMLCGHTHGGQIWPFGYVVSLLNHGMLVGRYDVDGMPVIVGRGTGTWGSRMRLWWRGEILRITLRAPK